MLAVIQALAQAGPPEGFGDDDGGRVFNPRRNRAEHMTDPLIIGATLFQDAELGASATLTEEAIWLLGEQALSWTRRRADAIMGPKSQSFRDGGVFLTASSQPPQQMVIDAGPQGTGRSGHGHADALSVKLAFGGRRWLVDAGTFCYIGRGDERNTFRGTRAHNTLAVDGLDQSEPDGPFAWNFIPETKAEIWIPGETFTLFAGSHSGYERLPEPVRHRRLVFHLRGSFWLVRDVAEGRGCHLLETSWHFAQDLEVSAGSGFVAAPKEKQSAPDGGSRLILLPVADPRWRCERLSEYVSPAYGVKESAPVVRCSARVELPAEHAVLLIPKFSDVGEAGHFFREDSPEIAPGAPEAAYRYQQGNTAHHFIFRKKEKEVWSFGPWTSDARFFYCCAKDRRVNRVTLCEGSFVALRGKSLISQDTTLQWLEWTRREGEHRVACSDAVAAGSFSGSALDSELTI
jgi:hypothetical protein